MDIIAKAAYTAGIVDGEGSISMVRHRGKKCNKSSFQWRIVIKVDNCDRILIEWLHREWNGHVLFDMDKGLNRKLQHRWTVVGNNARYVINAVMPFLIIKKERADWAQEVLRIQKEELTEGYRYTEESKTKLLGLRRRFQNDPNKSLATRCKIY